MGEGEEIKILIACEFSGIVREAFKARGHDAWSCDLLPTEIPGQHIQDDVLKHLDDGWDMMIAHPPCTYLCNSGVQFLHVDPLRPIKMVQAQIFFMEILTCGISKICVENPIPHKYCDIPRYSQIINPWQHGHENSKRTCLWLKNLPLIQPTKIVPRGEFYKSKTSKRTNAKWYSTSKKNRSRTFHGIAAAMASQWF